MIRRVVVAEAKPGARAELAPEDLRHLERVLRARPGLEIEVMDGRGGVFRAVFLGRAAPQIEVLEPASPRAEIPSVVVALGCLKGARMDWAVEKLSELGVRSLVPLLAERSVAAPRLERWRRIARESAKQCGRATILEIEPPIAPAGLVTSPGGDRDRLLFDPGGPLVADRPPVHESALLVVGPEGGFTAGEKARLEQGGFAHVSLAGPIMRAETAAIAAAAVTIAVRSR